MKNYSDSIVAIATPPGAGAIAVIRLSGDAAFTIANDLFPSKDLLAQPSHTMHVGFLQQEETLIDEVVISLYKNPRSYTGEDVVEISTHGSPYVQEQVMQACISKGARLAKAGEFTQRAFIHGKMDLTQAEAVGDLIASDSKAQQQASLHNLRGGFKADLIAIKEKLIEFSALMELELDFAEEDVAFADRAKFAELLESSQTKVQALIDSFALGNVVQKGVKVAIVGKPNAGKSTLLNTLLHSERAIVSTIAGTTRDTIEESISIKGILFHFIDTAGIRHETTDEIENLGIQKSLEKIEQADVVLLLSEEENLDPILLSKVKEKAHIVVINKIDKQTNVTKNENYLYISAKEKTGIDTLTNRLYDAVIKEEIHTENTLITNTRHLQHLQKIASYLSQIQEGLDQNRTTDLIAPDIKLCLHEIGELTGTVTNEHVLDYVFSKFCIGK